MFAGKVLKTVKFCRKNRTTAQEDKAKYSIFPETLTGRLGKANLKLARGINELVMEVGEEEGVDVSWSDITGNKGVGKIISP